MDERGTPGARVKMSSKKFFSWSKARSSSEPYHRTGGLLSIDTSVGDSDKETFSANDAKSNPHYERRRPPNLNLSIPYEYNNHRNCLSPASARHNAALVNSATNLLAVVNDMLRSPALSATLCPGFAELHKPLPSRPRSVSLPTTPDLPAELPGSILLDNQGILPSPVAGPSSHSTSTMRPVRSGNALSSTATARPSPSRVLHHKKSLSEASLQRRSKSRPNLITSPLSQSSDSKLTTCSVSTNGDQTTTSGDSTRVQLGAQSLLQPAPLIVEGKPWSKSGGESSGRRDESGTSSTPTPTSTRSKRIDELKATITAQDNTISTLQAQFGSLRKSHEAEIASLKDAHTAAVASLQDYTRVLEDSQRTLHHTSSNHLLLLLDTGETPLSPGILSPTRDSPQTATGENSATSLRSFQSALEQQTRSPLQAKDITEMDNLKRKLSAARRPETGNRDMIRELNQYKQNNAALQKQIESLMAKLNQSKKNERTLSQALEDIEKNVNDWQEKARKVDKLEKSSSALQNTIDHLEHRLEVANCNKIDAEEALFNVKAQRSPFDQKSSKVELHGPHPNEAHMSMSTVFSSGSHTDHSESQDPSTLAAFIAHIERLQDQLKQRDARALDMENQIEKFRNDNEQLARDYQEVSLQSDIQSKLLGKNKQSEVYVEQLRTAIIERESTIGEKDKSLRMAERQLEHHQLLLHAEIRRHATMSLLANTQSDPLPELSSLASKDDVDRWIQRLQARLKKEKPQASEKEDADGLQAIIDDLRKEIDFYVREIIYYKLDIKGYKSDIKKLKNIAQRLGNYGNRASDIESPTPSLCRSGDTPIRSRFSGAVGLTISNTPSPISAGAVSTSIPNGCPMTPPIDSPKRFVSTPKRHALDFDSLRKTAPHTPPREGGSNAANLADGIEPGVSPRSIARLSSVRRKPTVRQPLAEPTAESDVQCQPTSPDQEKFGDMATKFPLSTPAAPQRVDTQRSQSDSIIQMYTTPRTPDWSPSSNRNRTPDVENIAKSVETRSRSESASDTKEKTTPDRPPRPEYGLYESPRAPGRINGPPTPPRVDIMAEALKNSPRQESSQGPPQIDRKASEQSTSELRGFSNSQLSRTNSAGSASAIPAPLSLRPRAGSADSAVTILPASPPQRNLSSSSSGTIPFIIAMPSPHNPALITPTATVPPSACSITGKSAPSTQKVTSPTSRNGVGGTMASSTPLTSPVSHPDSESPKSFFSGALPTAKGSSSIMGGHRRNASLGMPSRKENEFKSAKAGGHSRNTSAGSIRSAMQLPSSLMKGKGKARKEDISGPRPLASPFDIDHTNGGGNELGMGIGKAI